MSRSCKDCAASISRQSKTGRCRRCVARATGSNPALIERRRATRAERRDVPPVEPKTCACCPATLGARNRSGRCRSCLAREINANPEFRERQRAGIKAWFAEPDNLDAARARMKRYMDGMPAADVERRREHGRRMYRDVLTRPEVVAKRVAGQHRPEVRARRGQSLSDRWLPWCPRDLRPLYREIRAKGTPTEEARAAIEELIPGTAAHTARELANHGLAARLRRERDRAESY